MSNHINIKDSYNVSWSGKAGNNGIETENYLESSFYWYQKAAENGDENAMDNLACAYYYGEGTEENLEKAFYWFQEAAENGNNKAMNNLAICYENGKGAEKNLEK